MTATTWHVPEDVLEHFAVDPRTMDPVSASSAEAHLLACASCRGRVAAAAPDELAMRTWTEIIDRVDAPRPTLMERSLVKVGTRPETARLVAATPALELAWLAAVIVVTAVVAFAADVADLRGPMLVLAPLVPLGSVVVAFTPTREVGGEAAFAAPVSGLSLMLRRTLVVTVASMVVLAAGSLALPGLEPSDIAWLLPAVALAATTVAASTRWPVEDAAAAVGIVWVTLIGVVQTASGWGPVAESVLVSPLVQVGALVVSAIALAIAGARRDQFLLDGSR